jgi:hypothetical protein
MEELETFILLTRDASTRRTERCSEHGVSGDVLVAGQPDRGDPE